MDSNAYWGVSIIDNGHGLITGTNITQNLVGLFLRNNASAAVGGETRIGDSGAQGIRVWDGSSLILGIKAYVDSNQADGVHVVGNSTVTPLSSTKIANNRGSGFNVRDTSLLHVTSGNNPDVVGNNGWGIFCEGWPADARLSPPGYTTANVFGNSMGQINCPGYLIP